MKRSYKVGQSPMEKSEVNRESILKQQLSSEGKGVPTGPQGNMGEYSEAKADIDLAADKDYQPIATELADKDEEFQKQHSALERPLNVIFTPQVPEFRVPTTVMIKQSE